MHLNFILKDARKGLSPGVLTGRVLLSLSLSLSPSPQHYLSLSLSPSPLHRGYEGRHEGPVPEGVVDGEDMDGLDGASTLCFDFRNCVCNRIQIQIGTRENASWNARTT